MKRILASVLTAATVLSLTACASVNNNSGTDSGKYEIAMVTDYGSIDDKSFNQGAWEGVEKYGKEKKISYQYYRPTEKSTDGYLNGIEMAINGGAKIVVCPGFLFEPAIFKAQDMHPDIKFIIIDGVPQNGDYTEFKTATNTYSILFAEQQSGFLAGYAAVKDGYKKLGFLGGMAVPAVVRFGYGFIQGAEYAAKEMALPKDEIQIKYGYTGGFDPMPEYQTKAASWYQSGTEIIFSCGGLVINNVTAAAEAAGSNKKVIGVDVDQKAESDTVITSAMKMLSKTVFDGLSMFYDGKFPGGENAVLGAKDDAIGLPDDFSRFKAFKKADYEKAYAMLKNDTDKLASAMIVDTENGKAVTVKDIAGKMTLVKVEEVA